LVEVLRWEWLPQLAWTTPYDRLKFWGAVRWRGVRNFCVVGSCLWNIRVGEICCFGYGNRFANRSLESPITDRVMSAFCIAPIALPGHFGRIIPSILLVF
jgi:hypothetical protein